MPFKFRLEKVLSLRRDEVTQAQRDIQTCKQALEQAIQELHDIEFQLKKTQEEMIENNYQMAEEYLRVIKRLAKNLEAKELEIEERKSDLEKAKQALVQAQMRLEAMEKLKEKQKAEYIEAENKREQLETDERVSLKFASDLIKKQQEEEEGL